MRWGVFVLSTVLILAAYEIARRRKRRPRTNTPPDIEWDEKGKCWLVRSYRDVVNLLRSPDIKANYLPSFTACLPAKELANYDFLLDFFSRWPLFQDGEEQRRSHNILAELFTADRVDSMQGLIDAAVEETLRPLREERGTWDAVARFAKPLPLRVILAVLGLPADDAPDMQAWAQINNSIEIKINNINNKRGRGS